MKGNIEYTPKTIEIKLLKIKCDEELVGGTGHGDEYCLSTYICTKCGKTIKRNSIR